MDFSIHSTRVRVGMDVQIWKTHLFSPQLCCISAQTAAFQYNYQSIKFLIKSRIGCKMRGESLEKRLHNVEHRGVNLLLLYRAAACLAPLLWACSIPVTLIRSNFKKNHKEFVNMGHNIELYSVKLVLCKPWYTRAPKINAKCGLNGATCCAKKATLNWDQPVRSSIDYSAQLVQQFANKAPSKMLPNVPLRLRSWFHCRARTSFLNVCYRSRQIK